MEPEYEVCVIGLGYIGLPTAAVFADGGCRVLGVDVNPEIVHSINRGEIHIVEPGLEDVVKKVVANGTMTASTRPSKAGAFIIAVPTPLKDDKTADLTYIFSAIETIAPLLSKGNIVVLESTSPPRTTQLVSQAITESRPDLAQEDIHLAYAPERVLPGRAMVEILENDRVIGGQTPEAARQVATLYERVVTGAVLTTEADVAELVKLSENAFRDTNIAFANELSTVATKLGVDVWEVIKLANHHPRVNIMQPGPGVGGHCIAVDPWFLASAALDSSQLIQTARQINDERPWTVINSVQSAMQEDNEEWPVTLMGLSFKKNIDDFRGSPAITIAEELARSAPGSRFYIVEPHINELPPSLGKFENVVLESDSLTAIENSSTVVLLVDHDFFLELPRDVLGGKRVIDTRGMWA